jgi:hypothetical protein
MADACTRGGWNFVEYIAMDDRCNLLQTAVDAFIKSEQENFRAGIHRRGLGHWESYQRHLQTKAIYGWIEDALSGRSFSGPVPEVVELRLRKLADACRTLAKWEQLLPRDERTGFFPYPGEIGGVRFDPDLRADDVVGWWCAEVERALSRVFELVTADSGGKNTWKGPGEEPLRGTAPVEDGYEPKVDRGPLGIILYCDERKATRGSITVDFGDKEYPWLAFVALCRRVTVHRLTAREGRQAVNGYGRHWG